MKKGMISSSSQQLAAGASEQAASIEETFSSLEEMSAMTRKNAENATEANNLMKEAKQVVTQANGSMTELTASMEEIFRASEETSKIIKTIDGIAFQTNLLALNAAVEAARAGEAGAGFAVVAEEVRNLAMRAAEASKNTAVLIESTVKRVKDGSELLGQTNSAFSKVVGSTGKVGELVDEIAERRSTEEKLSVSNEKLQRKLEDITKLQKRLKEELIRDSLTGLYNRRFLLETIDREFASAVHDDRPLTVLLMDIDYFKQVNDNFGHQTGDLVLKTIAGLLQQYSRKGDMACRIGGEEFILLLPSASLDNGLERAEEFR